MDCFVALLLAMTALASCRGNSPRCAKRMMRGGGRNGGALTQRTGYRNEMNVVAGYSFRVMRTLNVP